MFDRVRSLFSCGIIFFPITLFSFCGFAFPLVASEGVIDNEVRERCQDLLNELDFMFKHSMYSVGNLSCRKSGFDRKKSNGAVLDETVKGFNSPLLMTWRGRMIPFYMNGVYGRLYLTKEGIQDERVFMTEFLCVSDVNNRVMLNLDVYIKDGWDWPCKEQIRTISKDGQSHKVVSFTGVTTVNFSGNGDLMVGASERKKEHFINSVKLAVRGNRFNVYSRTGFLLSDYVFYGSIRLKFKEYVTFD